MGKILGLSGKLQSGKGTLTNWLYAHVLTLPLNQVKLESGEVIRLPLTPRAYVNPSGKLMVGLNDNEDQEFDVDSRDQQVMEWLHNNVWYFFKHFAFAEPLKDLCTNLVGISNEAVWGTHEDKNKLTTVLWEDFPKEQRGKNTGPMSGRECMEQVAKLIRKLNPDAFCLALKKNIEGYNSTHSLVNDIRRENELDLIQSMGGKVIRLTRTTEEAANNSDESNVGLDDCKKFDYILDNSKQNLEETLAEFRDYLLKIEWMNEVEVK